LSWITLKNGNNLKAVNRNKVDTIAVQAQKVGN